MQSSPVNAFPRPCHMRFGFICSSLLLLFASFVPDALAASPFSASIWTETPTLLTEPYVAYAPNAVFYADPIAIRKGQQELWFNTAGQDFFRMDVCIVTALVTCDWNSPGSEWTTLYSGPPTFEPVHWVSVPQTPDEYTVRLRYDKANGMTTHTYTMAVVPPAQHAYSDGQGNTMLQWDGTTSALDSPFLVVEGIDAENINTPAHYYGLGVELFGLGRARGADVLILSFANGGVDMRTNAEAVEDAIGYVNQIKTGSRKLDVAGVSMGGVIVRYALAEMENDGVAHDVSRFVSIDGPQQGAVVDRELLNLDEVADDPPAALASMAGKQLLVYNPLDTANPTLHDLFFDELEALNGDGYPHQTLENVGVAFSSPAPNPYVGQKWLEIVVAGVWSNRDFYIEAGHDESLPGSWLPLEQSEIGGYRAGGFVSYESERFVHPTFIPYDSALDRVNGVSQFDYTLDADFTRHHNNMPEEIVEPLLTRLGYPDPLTASISRPTALDEGDQATWTAYASGGTGTYAYRWYYSVLEDVWTDTGVTTPSYTRTAGSVSFTLKARVTSGTQVAEPMRYVAVTPDGDGGPPCKPNSGPCPSPPELVSDDATGASAKASAMASAQATAQVFAAPATFTLEAARPNPFRAATTLRFSLPEAAQVRLAIYDALGREVARPVDGPLEAGYHTARFTASDLPSGLYIVRLSAGSFTATEQVTVVQ